MTDPQKEVRDRMSELSKQNSVELERAKLMMEVVDQLIDKNKDAIEESRFLIEQANRFKK
jgi:hypothetical protein